MGRYRRRMFENYQEEGSADELYNNYKSELKGSRFYVHSLVFVLVNAFILNFDKSNSI
jgi:hypothetical protein